MARRSFSFSFAEFVFLILLFLSGLALAFSGGGFVVNFQRVGFSVVTSLQKAVYSVCDGVTGVFTAVAELKSLKAENQELKEKLKNYEFLQRNNTEIRKENERLREQLQFATHIEQKNFPAQIIGRNPDNIYSGITINKGSRSGIKKGMSVIAVQNGTTGLVGKIVTVGLETTKKVLKLLKLLTTMKKSLQTLQQKKTMKKSQTTATTLLQNQKKKMLLLTMTAMMKISLKNLTNNQGNTNGIIYSC